jgi:hypothetical protein
VLLVWILGSVVYYFETNLKKDLFGWSIWTSFLQIFPNQHLRFWEIVWRCWLFRSSGEWVMYYWWKNPTWWTESSHSVVPRCWVCRPSDTIVSCITNCPWFCHVCFRACFPSWALLALIDTLQP